MCDDDYFVEVGGYSGPRQFTDPGREKWVSIPKMNYRTDCNRHSRQGYPIRLAYALTIHKSQGQTTNKVVVDLGKNEKSLGMAYVALSRVKHYSGLAVVPFPKSRLDNIKKSTNLKPRIEEEERLHVLASKRLEEMAIERLQAGQEP